MTFKVGIDLGTTNSVVAYMKQNRPAVVRSLEGIDWTPSVVQHVGNKLIVGKRARDNLAEAPQGTVAWSIKRFIGRMPDDPAMQRARELVSYPVEPPPPGGDELVIRLANKPFTPVELSAEILKHIVAGVEKSLRQRPTHAVITVPAYFTERQKAATKRAGELAGLGVLGILDEPSAAALAYGIDLGTDDSRTVLVFDLGGGTFDVSILMLSGAGQSLQFRIGGDNFLGGDDFDNIILSHLLGELPPEMRREPLVIAQLKGVAEEAKIALSTTDVIAIDRFLRTPSGGAPLPLSTEITRDWFQRSSRSLVDRALAQVHEVLSRAKLDRDQIHRVLMVGGSSRLPAVVDAVTSVFGPDKVDTELDGMLCVALGAAVRASQIEVEETGAPKSTPAADVAPPIITITPRPIGVELADGTLSVLIDEGTVLPTEPRLHTYSTARASQTEIRLRFYEGHQPLARRNDHINDVVITLAKPVPKNTPVDITFHLDMSGIAVLSVSVADKLLIKDARIDRVIPTAQSDDDDEPNAPKPPQQSLDDVQWRMTRILDTCKPILDSYPEFRDEWRRAVAAIERAIEHRDDAAKQRALEHGARLLQAGLPPHIWAYYNGIYYKTQSANVDEVKAIDRHLQQANTAAQKHDTSKVRAELDELHGEVAGIWDRQEGRANKPDKGPGGIVPR